MIVNIVFWMKRKTIYGLCSRNLLDYDAPAAYDTRENIGSVLNTSVARIISVNIRMRRTSRAASARPEISV